MSTRQYSNYADLITFSRASNATYLDSDGLIKTASSNVPRIEYDADGNRLGLLVEEARTNLLTYSEEFDNAAWVKSRSTVAATNTVIAPDGTLTGDKLVDSTDAGTHRAYRTISGAALVTYTFSLYVKAAEQNRVALGVTSQNETTRHRVLFELTGAGSGATELGSGTFAIQLVGNGWYKCQVSGTIISGDTGVAGFIYLTNATGTSYVGTGTDGIYIWGAQLEAGAFPTSYIPTAGATATRSADIASIPVADFGYNDEAGTFVVEFDYVDPNNEDTNYLLSGGTLARFFYNNTGTSTWFIYDGQGMSVSGVDENGNPNKVGIAMDDGGTTVYLNGAYNVANAAITPQDNLNYSFIAIGGVAAGTELNGHIKSIKYYPRRLTNAQLQELTS